MKRPRIAHVTTIDFSLRHLLLNQLIAIRDAGYDVTGISAPGPDVAFLEGHGIRHIAVPMTRAVTPLSDLAALLNLIRIMRRERFDIVHTHNPKPGLLGQIAARAAGIPHVVNTVHGFYFHERMSFPKRRFFIALEKIAARCSDVILSQSAEDVETAVLEGIAPWERLRHLGNGIDIIRFDPARMNSDDLAKKRNELGIPQGRRVVGFVGRLVEEKGVLDLFDAARRLDSPNVCFLLVGPTDSAKPDAVAPELARKYGVARQCVFAGMRYDMPEMYALMDVFVLPSHREGFPRAPMEAAAMGIPTIASDIRGCREAVVRGESGLLTPVQNPGRLAGAVDRLLSDASLRGELSRRARRIAEERFDERAVFEQVLHEYDQLLGESP